MHTMARVLAAVLLPALVAGALGAAPGAASAQSALDIMKKEREAQRARDEEERQTMKLVDKQGANKQRRVVRWTLQGPNHLMKNMIRFLAPRDVENTGLLTWEARDGNDDQWLYLPATKQAKRIAASGKKNRFMGTDFAYEDLRDENLDIHRYTLLGSEAVEGQDCFVIEAVPASEAQAGQTGYSKRKLWVRKDISYIAKREYYDKNGKLKKVRPDRKLAQVKGSLWRADEVEMDDVQDGTKTILITEKRALDKGLKDAFFSEAELTRPGS
jgi:outer membrane lipoprotein-sorting protein